MRSSCPVSPCLQRHWFTASRRKGGNTFIGCRRAPPAWKRIRNRNKTASTQLCAQMWPCSAILERKRKNAADREGSLLRPCGGNRWSRYPNSDLRGQPSWVKSCVRWSFQVDWALMSSASEHSYTPLGRRPMDSPSSSITCQKVPIGG